MKYREFKVPLMTLIMNDNPSTPKSEVIHVIEHKALEQAQARIEELEKALKEVEVKIGQTMLGTCCVDDTCKPYWVDGVKLSDCTYEAGALDGFNMCGYIAREALRGSEK